MKKNLFKAIIPIALSLAIAAPVAAAEEAAPLDDTAVTVQDNDGNYDRRYHTFEGIINDVYESETSVTITVSAGDDEIYVYHIYENTPVFDQNTMDRVGRAELTVGKEVYVSYPYDTPMALSYPPQINPEVVVIKDEKAIGFVKVDMFDKNGLSFDKNLKLNLSEDTNIVSLDGEKVDYTELGESVLVVFYAITTFSIPPQTPPLKVIVLRTENDKEPEAVNPNDGKAEEFIATLSEEQVIEKNGLLYVRLRDAAEAFGYEVAWNETIRTAALTKGSVSYKISVDQIMFEHNGSDAYFIAAPFILNERMFVEAEFILSELGK